MYLLYIKWFMWELFTCFFFNFLLVELSNLKKIYSSFVFVAFPFLDKLSGLCSILKFFFFPSKFDNAFYLGSIS